jgi:hypothetical protein
MQPPLSIYFTARRIKHILRANFEKSAVFVLRGQFPQEYQEPQGLPQACLLHLRALRDA